MAVFSWPDNEQDAIQEQMTLLELLDVEHHTPMSELQNCLAIGTAYNDANNLAVAVGIEFSTSGHVNNSPFEVITEVKFKYVSGLLAFRVGPAICDLVDQLDTEFDLFLIDGQGIAHPRGLGLASHIGVLFNTPSVGITRNKLYGRVSIPSGDGLEIGWVEGQKNKSKIGCAVRVGGTDEVAYCSPGHLCTVSDCVDLVRLISDTRSPFPRPLRIAHAVANNVVRSIDRN